MLVNLKMATILGPGEITRGQFSPEEYHLPKVKSNLEYDCRADVWALGVILYYTVTKKFPFEKSNYKKITSEHLDEYQISPYLVDLIPRLLNPNEDESLKISTVLKHYWFDSSFVQKYKTW